MAYKNKCDVSQALVDCMVMDWIKNMTVHDITVNFTYERFDGDNEPADVTIVKRLNIEKFDEDIIANRIAHDYLKVVNGYRILNINVGITKCKYNGGLD